MSTGSIEASTWIGFSTERTSTSSGFDPICGRWLDEYSREIQRKILIDAKPDWAPQFTVIGRGYATNSGLITDEFGRRVAMEQLDQPLDGRETGYFRPVWTEEPRRCWLLTHRYQANYFHWLFEVVPKLLLAERASNAGDVFYIDQSQEFQRSIVNYVLGDGMRVLSATQRSHLRFLQGLALRHWDAFSGIPQPVVDMLRSQFGVPAGPPRRIYVSREGARGRRVLNEQAVLDILVPAGFEAINPSRLSWSEQVEIFASAEAVCGPHGAGLSNAVFCSPGTPLIELSAPRYIFPCWLDLSRKCKLQHRLVPGVGTDFAVDHGWKYQWEDFEVDLDRLRSAIHDLGFS
ncbi:MAG: glycosyltransferase family 61 protein [Rhodanobacteraceae bacterium]|nr:glycosyltransferase family 61 protein [Rhodanobacteraceae bacterium]